MKVEARPAPLFLASSEQLGGSSEKVGLEDK
jgi:hypothetical protein